MNSQKCLTSNYLLYSTIYKQWRVVVEVEDFLKSKIMSFNLLTDY